MLIVNLKNSDVTIECQQFEEQENGLVLYRTEDDIDSESTIVGYVPYDNLHYIEIETQSDDRVLP